MTNKKLNFNKIINNPKLRKRLAVNSLYWFFHIYLSDYVYYPTADFQRKIISIVENQNIQNAFIVAFRGSAKSTIATLALPLWSIIGKHKKSFVIIISQTQSQARLILANIRRELETNHLFIKDFGPFNTDQPSGEWNSSTIVVGKSGMRISVFSSGESIRGIRHSSTRPDLIVCDDLEDLSSVKSKEIRNQTFEWFTGDVIPIGDRATKMIVIGNLLHEDSLMMKLKRGVTDNTIDGEFYSYPLVSPDNIIAWPGKYPTKKAIEDERRRVGNDPAWFREYLLQILPPEDRIIKSEWIKYYDELPSNLEANCTGYLISIDPAISEKQTADKTGILTGRIYRTKDLLSLYILPNIFNKRIDYPTTKETLRKLSDTVDPKRKTTVLVEQVAYQASIIQDLQRAGYPVVGIDPHGQDKLSRLNIVSTFVKNGNVFFPRYGSSELVDQLVNFGVERYDDLVDAFTMLVNQVFVSPPSGLTHQDPIMIRVNFHNRGNTSISSEDWADAEDRQMFHRRNPSSNWHRLLG